ncbi:RNA-binding protein 28 [Histomonas meleagridis]|uniref:RNA-binding protein 28 n=1 Tax=Histomonas meleagridis TaxID=135588 RepID=UPI00355A11A6|nr:RNA-binding protein 28 [Histomonas meleagridis]KAH0802618.1 RNA-binding protein 28 [Histomonas meleagridis]
MTNTILNETIPDDLDRYPLMVSNLSFNENKDSLFSFFSQCGEILSIKIVKNPTGNNTGMAFIDFKNKISAISAINCFNEKRIHGRFIKVTWAKAIVNYIKEGKEIVSNEIEKVSQRRNDYFIKDNENVYLISNQNEPTRRSSYFLSDERKKNLGLQEIIEKDPNVLFYQKTDDGNTFVVSRNKVPESYFIQNSDETTDYESNSFSDSSSYQSDNPPNVSQSEQVTQENTESTNNQNISFESDSDIGNDNIPSPPPPNHN